MKYANHLGLAFIAAAAMGCATDEPTTIEPNDTTTALELTETATGVTGTLGQTSFTSKMASESVLEITVKVNGMMLTALVDATSGVMEFDGFALDTGENTQMTDEDRASLVELRQALAPLGEDLPYTLEKARGFIATISEHPTTVDLQALRLTEETRGWTSLCYAKNTYYPATHDCQIAGFNDDRTKLDGAYLSSTGDLGGPDGTAFYFPYGGNFTCCSTGITGCGSYSCSVPSAGWYSGIEVDHDTRVENAYGNCMGVCGGGCPGSYQFTVDCLNHDQCVRNGHVIASAYCDDQYTSSMDDWYSAPNCGA